MATTPERAKPQAVLQFIPNSAISKEKTSTDGREDRDCLAYSSSQAPALLDVFDIMLKWQIAIFGKLFRTSCREVLW